MWLFSEVCEVAAGRDKDPMPSVMLFVALCEVLLEDEMDGDAISVLDSGFSTSASSPPGAFLLYGVVFSSMTVRGSRSSSAVTFNTNSKVLPSVCVYLTVAAVGAYLVRIIDLLICSLSNL